MDRLYLLTPSSLLSFFKGKKGKSIEVKTNVITKGRVGTWATRDHSQKVPFKSLNCKIMIEMINYCCTWSNRPLFAKIYICNYAFFVGFMVHEGPSFTVCSAVPCNPKCSSLDENCRQYLTYLNTIVDSNIYIYTFMCFYVINYEKPLNITFFFFNKINVNGKCNNQ